MWRISCKQNHWYLALLLTRTPPIKPPSHILSIARPKQKETGNYVWLNWSTSNKTRLEQKGFWHDTKRPDDWKQNRPFLWLPLDTKKQCLKTAQNVLTVLLEVTQTFVPNLHFSHSVALTTFWGQETDLKGTEEESHDQVWFNPSHSLHCIYIILQILCNQ